MREGCLNLVQKSRCTEEPREYIPTRLMSNHAQWDSQRFYLWNDDGLFPPTPGGLSWRARTTGTTAWSKTVSPLLGALKRLRKVGLTAALALSAVHHRLVLLLMSRPLRMDKMGPRAPSRDLEVCQMSREALPDVEVAARVRAAISDDF